MSAPLVQIYNGAGFDRSMEWYDFLGRPCRNITYLGSEEDGYAFDLYVKEKGQWVHLEGATAPVLVGAVQDLNDHPKEIVESPSLPQGRDASAVTPDMVRAEVEKMRKDEIPEIDIQQMVLHYYPEVAAQVLGATDDQTR